MYSKALSSLASRRSGLNSHARGAETSEVFIRGFTKDRTMKMRVAAVELTDWQQMAAWQGMSVSEFMRQAMSLRITTLRQQYGVETDPTNVTTAGHSPVGAG